MTSNSTCANCGSSLAGNFCSSCGERSMDRSDLSLRAFLSNTLDVITSLDSRVFRTFWYLLIRPGFLTEEYLAGRRLRYVRPLQVFLVINVIYFFVQAYSVNVFSTTLQIHTKMLPYSNMASRLVDEAIQRKQWDAQTYQRQFDHVIDQQSRSMILLNVPLIALMLGLLFWRQKRYYVEHLIASLHIYSWFLIVIPVLFFLCQPFRFLLNDNSFTLLVSLSTLIYVFMAVRRVYKEGFMASGLKALALTMSFIVILQCYRLILFFTTYFTVLFT